MILSRLTRSAKASNTLRRSYATHMTDTQSSKQWLAENKSLAWGVGGSAVALAGWWYMKKNPQARKEYEHVKEHINKASPSAAQ
ncbi:hypothetical protein JCM5296_000087 [Sporobolomyces johnsonii]